MNVLKLIIGIASIGAGIFIVVDGTLWGGLVVVAVGIALLTTTALSKRLYKGFYLYLVGRRKLEW